MLKLRQLPDGSWEGYRVKGKSADLTPSNDPIAPSRARSRRAMLESRESDMLGDEDGEA